MEYIFSVFLAAVVIFAFCITTLEQLKSEKRLQEERKAIFESIAPKKDYSVSGYYERMENAALDILKEQEQVDHTIILWWGFDGLRLKDGKIEWISRKPTVYVDACEGIENAPYISQAVKRYIIEMGESIDDYPKKTLELQPVHFFDETQSTQAQINALQMQNAAFQVQAAQQVQNMAIMSALQSCCCNQTILQ